MIEENEGSVGLAHLAEWVKDNTVIGTHEVIDPNATPFLLHNGEKVIDLREFAEVPSRIKTAPKFAHADSFCQYVNDFKGSTTKLFASIKGGNITAAIDYHGKDDPSWSTHEATLQPTRTPEWEALRATQGKPFQQAAFADWLDEWNHIVIEPDSAKIIEVANNLQGTTACSFKSTIQRTNGNMVFSYTEDTQTNQIKVPEKIHFSVPLFWGQDLTNIQVALRFRVPEGKPNFSLVIYNMQKLELDSLEVMMNKVEEVTGLKVLLQP